MFIFLSKQFSCKFGKFGQNGDSANSSQSTPLNSASSKIIRKQSSARSRLQSIKTLIIYSTFTFISAKKYKKIQTTENMRIYTFTFTILLVLILNDVQETYATRCGACLKYERCEIFQGNMQKLLACLAKKAAGQCYSPCYKSKRVSQKLRRAVLSQIKVQSVEY